MSQNSSQNTACFIMNCSKGHLFIPTYYKLQLYFDYKKILQQPFSGEDKIEKKQLLYLNIAIYQSTMHPANKNHMHM